MKSNQLIVKAALSIEESKRYIHFFKKLSWVFISIGLAIGFAGIMALIASHKLFGIAFYKGDVREGADSVKAMWNVMMYFVPWGMIFLGAGCLFVAAINDVAIFMEMLSIHRQKRRILHFKSQQGAEQSEPPSKPWFFLCMFNRKKKP